MKNLVQSKVSVGGKKQRFFPCSFPLSRAAPHSWLSHSLGVEFTVCQKINPEQCPHQSSDVKNFLKLVSPFLHKFVFGVRAVRFNKCNTPSSPKKQAFFLIFHVWLQIYYLLLYKWTIFCLSLYFLVLILYFFKKNIYFQRKIEKYTMSLILSWQVERAQNPFHTGLPEVETWLFLPKDSNMLSNKK